MSRKNYINKLIKGGTQEQTAFTALISVATGVMGYFGLSLPAETANEEIRAILMSLASTAVIYMVWNLCMNTIPTLDSKWVKSTAFAAMLGFGAILIPTSSQNNATGVIGYDAIETNQTEYVKEAETAFDNSVARFNALRSLSALMQGEIESFDNRINREIAEGNLTGTNGDGAVVAAMKSIKGRLASVKGQIIEFQEGSEIASGDALGSLKKMRKIINSPNALKTRESDLAKTSNDFREQLAKLDTRIFERSILVVLSTLERDLNIQSQLSKNNEIKRQQLNAIRLLRNDLENINESFSEFLLSFSDLSVGTLAAYEVLEPSEAAAKWWKAYLPIWFAAVCVDLSPLIYISFLTIIFADSTPEQRRLAVLAARTNGEKWDHKQSEAVDRKIEAGEADVDALVKTLEPGEEA